MKVREWAKKCSLWAYVGKVTIFPPLEEANIAAIEEAFTQESVLQSGGFGEENVPVEVLFYK